MYAMKVPAPLDPGFRPLEMEVRAYEQDALASGQAVDFGVLILRNQGFCDHYQMKIFPDGKDVRTVPLLDRLVKTLLWARGGWKIVTFGSQEVHDHLKAAYQADGERAFDADFMATVYERPFEVEQADKLEDVLLTRSSASTVGRHLNGCRIGFDAGGSDRKVSAVIDGEPVYSEEVVWFPKTNADPQYHYDGILDAMKTAASHMPRVDAIGVSSAGVYIDNKVMVASLFLKVPKEDFNRRVKTMYLDVAKEIGAPIEVANDGDVTALAGAMELNAGNVFGVAMGTSEAAGYVDKAMNITGWLNELAFAPVDANPASLSDEWSGDWGCGVKYFSQDSVIKLAPAAGIALDESLSPAEKLKVVQKEMASGNPEAAKIYETIGVYFGYTLGWYSRFYDIDHVLIMGRVTSGDGGPIILQKAQEVLDKEFPELAAKAQLHIPDEKGRRVGQSVAAASLPQV